ncbi:50S ribosomal protein L4 [bacterium]|nr:50S ribosomal protein L4 [bacterium]MBT3581174.1 50S ribosomal protein L4 [bacterium]MBT4551607.1 50S ribosomal protein L4 [bacterium]MBT5988193.1 50S ribosomal protein L4 [bacterium]MBT7087706.1 50S ribosomal protein L4 [bacterium]
MEKTSKSTEKFGYYLYLLLKQADNYKRQGTHSTKTRSEVAGGGAKPYKQKGTGRARRGTNSTPLRRGGGVVFGPKPKLYLEKVNKKLKTKTYKLLLDYKKDSFKLLADDADKTKELHKLVADDIKKGEKILFLLDNEADLNLIRAARNLKKSYISTLDNLDLNKFVFTKNIYVSKKEMEKLEGLVKG